MIQKKACTEHFLQFRVALSPFLDQNLRNSTRLVCHANSALPSRGLFGLDADFDSSSRELVAGLDAAM